MANELIFKNNIKLDGVTQVVNNSVAALDDNVLLTKAAVANMMTAGAYSAGNGISISNGEIAAKIAVNGGLTADSSGISVFMQEGNGLVKNAGTGKISVSKATSSTFGTVKVTNGNGLSIGTSGTSEGVVSMAIAGDNPGAVKVTTGNGLGYDTSSGAISVSLATAGAAGTVQVTEGN